MGHFNLQQFICSCLASWFSEKLPKLVALQIFQSSCLSCGEFHNHNTLSHHYSSHIKHIFWKHNIYHKEDTKVGRQHLATKFGFVPDWLDSHWTYFENITYTCITKRTPNLEAKILATKYSFVPDCLSSCKTFMLTSATVASSGCCKNSSWPYHPEPSRLPQHQAAGYPSMWRDCSGKPLKIIDRQKWR